MTELIQIEALVINECLDDAENLEQIYRTLVLQSEPTPCGNEPGRTELGRHITLAELADTVRSLVERRLLIVRHDPAELPADDLNYIWHCWFEAGPGAHQLHPESNSVGLSSP
jgi:hypothetical protein